MEKDALYSRQIGTYGYEVMNKITDLNIFISGLRGLGAEIAKNLILSGITKLTIHDNNIVQISDLSSNYCLQETDVNVNNRAKASYKSLKSLNPSIDLQIFDSDLSTLDVKLYDIVVLTESIGIDVKNINQICRDNKIAFICAECWGPLCFAFVDFGEEFLIKDRYGTKHEPLYVENISQSDPGIVKTFQPHMLSDEVLISFSEIKGMTELNSHPPVEFIDYIDSKTFAIPSTLNFSPYIKDGVINLTNIPCKRNYSSLKARMKNPKLNSKVQFKDITNLKNYPQFHLATVALIKFSKKYARLPTHEHIDYENLLQIASKYNEKYKILSVIDSNYIKLVSTFAKVQISPISSVWGGIISQEVLKITGTYQSLFQWGHLDFSEIFVNTKLSPLDSRYSDLISIIGKNNFDKLSQKNIFIVGAGALGCELIKHSAMMGIGMKTPITVTDNDSIELSNLSRQFLFKRENIGHNKSEVACLAAAKINLESKFNPQTLKVCKESENYFNDSFWEKLDLIISAVDNLSARKYLDEKSIWWQKPFIDSGTQGMNGSSQVILPKITISYGDLPRNVPQETKSCTLKSFPYLPAHCIEWSRDIFEEVFKLDIEVLKELNSDPLNFCETLLMIEEKSEQYLKLLQVYKNSILLEGRGKEGVIELSCRVYLDYFRDRIIDLLLLYPENSVNEQGVEFWTGTKRMPKPAELNADNVECLNFLFSTCNIYMKILGSTDSVSLLEISEFLKMYNPYEYKQKLYGKTEEITEYIENELEKFKKFSPNQVLLTPQQFEKDDDTNFHVEFILNASNIRANSYQLTSTDRLTAKIISGKIAPAIASTGSVISGFVALEIIKTALFDNIVFFKNTNFNLSHPLIIRMNPTNVYKLKDDKNNETSLTIWDIFEIAGPLTLEEFISHIMKIFNMKVESILIYDNIIYHSSMLDEFECFLNTSIEEVFSQISENKVEEWKNSFEVIVEGKDLKTNEKKLMPKIKYNFRSSN